MSRLIIRSAHVVSMDPGIGEIDGGDVLIDGDRIAAVGRGLDAGDAATIDAAGMIALPGFVDAHRHVWQTILRAVTSDMSFRRYFSTVLMRMGGLLTPEDVYVAHRVGMLDALWGGVTTVLDWSHIQNTPEHTDEIVRAYRESGARAVFAYGPPIDDARRWLIASTERHPADARRVRGILADDTALVTMAMGLRGPEYTPWETALDDLALARELDVPSVFHVGDARLRHIAAVAGLAERGLLGPDLVFGGGYHLDDHELRLIGDSGGAIVTSPELGMQAGKGFPPLARFGAHGIPTGIGADMLTGYGGSMFSLMRLTVQAQRLIASTEIVERGELVEDLAMSDADVLRLATIEGARAVGLGDRVGSITPGKQADLVLLDTSLPNLVPANNPIGLIVQYADTSNVDTVIVAGTIHKRGGRMLASDVDRLRGAATAASRRILEDAAARADASN